MALNLTPDTDADDIRSRFSKTVDREDIRTGDSRVARLRRNIQRQSRSWDTAVEVDPGHGTAHVEARAGKPPKVVITGREVEQPATGYSGRAWDWMVQRSFGVHEVGHIRYSDIDDKDDHLSDVESGVKGVAHQLWNAAEDGAIESQVTKRWPNYYEPLRTLRANLFDDNEVGIADPENGGYVFPVVHAAQATVLDLWMREVYQLNVGTLDLLLDTNDDTLHFATENDRELFIVDVYPLCEDLVDAALTTPNAKARNAKLFDIIEDIIDLLDQADADGTPQANGQSAEDDDGSGMPDDSRRNHSGAAESDADELGEVDDVRPADDDEDAGQAVVPGPGAGDMDSPADIDTDADIEAQHAETVTDDANEEAGATEGMFDELEEMQNAVSASAESLRNEKLVVPTHTRQPNAQRVQEAKAAARPLARILRQRLQSERRTETQRHKRRGRLDSSSLSRTALGQRDVMQQRTEPDEKDYHAAVILDRSGSMGGNNIEAAETAAGMLLYALEEVGVETMLVELEDTEGRLAKPFGVPTDRREDKVFHGETGGGTPLGDVSEITRQRLNREGGKRFAFVVTDGRPGDRQRFEGILQSCNFPVLGVTIGRGNAGEGVYHRSVSASPNDDLSATLQNLLLEVMF